MTTCGRCGVTDRSDRFVYRLTDREAEAREDGRPHEGQVYGREDRCINRQACRERAAKLRERTA